jgi:hypothetical protein
VAQQLAERVPRLEVLVVAEVRALPARHDPAAAVGLLLPRRGGAVRGSGGGGAEAHRTRRGPAGAPMERDRGGGGSKPEVTFSSFGTAASSTLTDVVASRLGFASKEMALSRGISGAGE